MSDRLSVQIVATDNASPKFVTVANAADKMGASVAKAGQTGANGLKQLDAAAKTSARSFDDLVDGALDVGQAVGLTVGVLGRLGQSALNESRSIDALGRAYGAAGDDIIAFTESIQENTRFSDDQARQAALTASTLTRNYGFTADELKNVLTISADLAAVTGLGLADATMRVTAALRGEAESAEYLGLTMNQQNIDRENLTLTMSNEEAGHYRLNALYEQAAFAQGAAAEQTEGLAGKTAQFMNEIQDGTQVIGRFLGPVGEVTSQLSNYGFAIAGAATGIKVLRDAQQALTTSTKAASLATTALTIATNPYVLAATAAVVVGGLLIKAHHDDEVAIRSYEEAVKSATTALFDLKEAQGVSPELEAAAAAQDRLNLAVQFGVKAREQYYEDIDLQQADLDLLEQRMLSTQEAADIEADLAVVIGTSGEALGENIAIVQDWTNAYLDGTLTADEFIQNMDDMAANAPHWGEALLETADSQRTLTTATKEQIAALHELAGATTDVLEISGLLNQAGADQGTQTSHQTQLWLDEQKAIDRRTAAVRDSVTASKDLDAVAERQAAAASLRDHILGSIESARAQAQAANEAEEAFIGMVDALGQMPTLLDVVGGATADLVSGLTDATDAVDTAVSIVLGGSEALGQGVARLDDWATGLTDAGDGVSRLDQLLADHKITQEQYNQTLNDVGRIQRANLAVEEDIATIQVQQSQYMADQTADLAVYVDGLTKLPEAQQRVALGFLDQAEAVKLNDAVMLAATASQGGFTEAASATILTMAEQDSVFRDMALSVGLLRYEIDETGAKKLVVNFEGAEGLKDTLDDLTTSINLLTDAILGVPAGTTAQLHVEGIEEVEAATAALAEFQTRANVQLNNTYGIGGMASDYPAGPAPESAPLPNTPPGGNPPMSETPAGRAFREVRLTVPVRMALKMDDLADTLASFRKEQAVEPLILDLELEPAPAEATATQTINDINAMTGTVTIDGTNDQAIESVTLAVAAANRARGTVAIAGNRSSFDSTIAGINGRILGTAYINIQATGGVPGGLGESFALGGVVPHAMNGIVGDGRNVLVGEAGPEVVTLPVGAYTHTAPASKDKMRNGGGGNIYVANLAIYPSDSNVYDSIVSALRSNGR